RLGGYSYASGGNNPLPQLLLAAGHARRYAAAELLREVDGDDRRQKNEQRDHIDDRQLPRPLEVGEDPDRERLLCTRGEQRDDDLVEREREGEQRPREQRRAQLRERHVAEGLPRVGAEIGRRLLERARHAPQPRERVVVDDDDAEGRVADDDRQEAERDTEPLERRLQREPGDDPRQRDRQDDDERDRLPPEEAVPRDSEREQRAQG